MWDSWSLLYVSLNFLQCLSRSRKRSLRPVKVRVEKKVSETSLSRSRKGLLETSLSNTGKRFPRLVSETYGDSSSSRGPSDPYRCKKTRTLYLYHGPWTRSSATDPGHRTRTDCLGLNKGQVVIICLFMGSDPTIRDIGTVPVLCPNKNILVPVYWPEKRVKVLVLWPGEVEIFFLGALEKGSEGVVELLFLLSCFHSQIIFVEYGIE